MPLQFQVVQAPLKFGLDEGTDPHHVPPGVLTTAENVRWEKSGRIQKRYGTAALTNSVYGGGSIPSAVRLFTRGNELALTDGSYVYSYTYADGWTKRGRVPDVGLTWSTSIDTADSIATSDAAVLSNGYIVEAWITGEPSPADTGSYPATSTTRILNYQIRDYTTGTVLTRVFNATTAPGIQPKSLRVLGSGTTWIIFYADNTGRVWAITSAGTLTVATDANATTNVVLDAIVMGSDFVFAYNNVSGGITLKRATFATTPVLQTTGTVTGETSSYIDSISLAGGVNEVLYITYSNLSDPSLAPYHYGYIKFSIANPSTLVQSVAPTTLETLDGGYDTANFYSGIVAAVRETSTTCILAYSYATALVPCGITKVVGITSTGTVTLSASCLYMRILSRPFALGSRFYCVGGQESQIARSMTAQNTGSNAGETLLIDVTRDYASTSAALRNCGKIDTLIGGWWYRGFISNPCTISASAVLLPTPYQSSVSSGYYGTRGAVKLVKATSAVAPTADQWRSVELGGETYLASGVLTAYDGFEALSYGFPYAPLIDLVNTNQSNSGGFLGSNTIATNYTYVCASERRGASGTLHRSPVSASKTASFSASVTTGKVNIAAVPPSLGRSEQNPPWVAYYRTTANGLVPQRITFNSLVSPGIRDVGQGSFPNYGNSADTYADSSLANKSPLGAQAAIYTAGGELDDMQPPACLTLCTHQNRLWMLAGDGRTVWVSKDYLSNVGTAPGFHPNVTMAFEKPITAMHALDDKLIAFASDTFYAVVGQGPAPNGLGASWETLAVQTDVGCTNPRSVASIPDGLLFQSSRGIHLLTRKLEVEWVGAPVKDQLSQYPNITSAVVVGSRSEVRFTANNAAGTAGVVLVYNYARGAWSTWKYTVSNTYGAPIADACLWNGVYTFATSAGLVFTEDTTTYLDGGAKWVPLVLETAWMSAGGPLAFQAVRRMSIDGTSNSNHDLTVSAAFDSNTTYAQSTTWAAGSSVTAIGPFETLDFQIGANRKCGAIRFKIQDATPSNPGTYPVGTGQGPTIDMVGFEFGMKPGLLRKASGQEG